MRRRVLAEPESSTALALARLPEVLVRHTPYLPLNKRIVDRKAERRHLFEYHALATCR